MKLKLAGLSFIFALCVTLSVSAQNPNDFRGFTWGSSISQIQGAEKAKFVAKEKEDLLRYEDQLGNVDCFVIYTFNDYDKLVSGNYVFTRDYTNSQLYLHDFDKFQQLLTDKYGKPKSSTETWRNDTPPSEKELYGQAIAAGYLSITAIWETERSVIRLLIFSINQKPSLQITYTYKSLSELDSKEELKKAANKL